MRDGLVRIDEAFSEHIAEQARAILWEATGCDPDDRSSWTRPVVRLNQFSQAPFQEAANTPKLRTAFDQLVGTGRWFPRDRLGTFPVRFPSEGSPGDDGWHIDVSFGDEHPDFMEWRANISSKGRTLLMLFLFSDVGVDDAPTRIRLGSHADVARQLAPAGEAGLTLRERRRWVCRVGESAGGISCGQGWHGISGPPVSRARRATASWNRTAIHGSTAPDAA